MQRLEVSSAVRHIYVIRRLKLNNDYLIGFKTDLTLFTGSVCLYQKEN
jgi:hypothetical protein